MPFPMMRKDEREKCGLSDDLIRRLNPRCFNFYLENLDKIRINESGNELWYVVRDEGLFRDIYSKVYQIKNPEGNKVEGFVFSGEDIEKYLDVINPN